ncbi:MAG: hypothetical protein HW405_639 [Candidatus Berkelbacteria bacterium]|nr:hypothetical protein [Candidatus Berkelbacteria bacterium]
MKKSIKLGLIVLVAIVIGLVVYVIIMLNIKGPYVALVQPGSPGAVVGFHGGDQIVSTNGQRVKTSQEFIGVVNSNAGKNMEVVFYRGFTKMKVTVKPSMELLPGGGRLGIALTDESIVDMYRKVRD